MDLENVTMYKAVIRRHILDSTQALLDALGTEPQMHQIFSRGPPFFVENM